MIFHSLLALIPFHPIAECEEVREVLDKQIPGYVWDIKEIGDGNINYIYLADRKGQSVLVKKALDYARINPEEFPLPVDRLFFEYSAYKLYEKICPERIPEIFFFDGNRSILAMEYLSPHSVLRKGLLEGKKYPHLAEHLGVFLGRALYLTSMHHLSRDEWRKNVSLFSDNTAMRRIIENLNFTDPFFGSSLNWWTSPELDEVVAEIQNNAQIREVVVQLKNRFLSHPEALCHGDLHTGSILATESDTRIFDTEFATYAPMSFDLGMLFANFIMAALASPAHGTDGVYLSSLTQSTWEHFEKTFRELWKDKAVDEKLREIRKEVHQLIGVEIIRRTIGLAHAADFASISDRSLRASIEKEALLLAKDLLLGKNFFK